MAILLNTNKCLYKHNFFTETGLWFYYKSFDILKCIILDVHVEHILVFFIIACLRKNAIKNSVY